MKPSAASPRVTFEPSEISANRPARPTVHRIQEGFLKYGAAVLERSYPRELIQHLQEACFARYGSLAEEELEQIGSRVGRERYMISVDVAPPFDDPRIYANPFHLEPLRALLGERIELDSYSVVIAYPGAEDQHVHLDHSLLFEPDRLGMALPPYAITVVVPLVDLNERTGSTRVWKLGKSAEPSTWQKMAGGDVIHLGMGGSYMMDYRLCHGGTANPGSIPRPILYLVYCRPWFRDCENFNDRPRLRMSAEALAAVPEAHRVLFGRVAGLTPHSPDHR